MRYQAEDTGGAYAYTGAAVIDTTLEHPPYILCEDMELAERVAKALNQLDAVGG
jgi:hypothetical protein